MILSRWIPLVALAITLVIRLLKSDTILPWTIPPRARVWVAFGLGVVAAGLERVVTGVRWDVALFDGIAGALVAIATQNLVVGSLRNGREIPVPGLTVRGARPGVGRPETIPLLPGDPP